ncbi:MAG: hypothetical protein OIN86_09640 [Candidatus Methanoperedens sp.]|nr:hypothetical protein [Candidatus Methanoperedens sp.]
MLLNTDVFIFEVLQPEIPTAAGKQRRFSITSTQGYSALSYALLPYAFVQDCTEAGYNQTAETAAVLLLVSSDIVPPVYDKKFDGLTRPSSLVQLPSDLSQCH